LSVYAPGRDVKTRNGAPEDDLCVREAQLPDELVPMIEGKSRAGILKRRLRETVTEAMTQSKLREV
jgi:hypothetical protein